MNNEKIGVPESVTGPENSPRKTGVLRKLTRGAKKKISASVFIGATIAGMPAGAQSAEIPETPAGKAKSVAAKAMPEKEAPAEVLDNLRQLQIRIEAGKVSEEEIANYKKLAISAFEAAHDVDPLGNDWSSHRESFGATEANYYINQLAKGDISAVQYAMDNYYLFVPEGRENRWGNGMLAEYVVSMLGLRAYEMYSELSPQQKDQLNKILADSFREENFKLDMTCGLDSWNTCSENYAGQVTKCALHVLFPEAAEMAGGREKLAQLEEKYLKLAYSAKNGAYSLIFEVSPIDGKTHLVVHNHGDQSAVYGNILNMDVMNAVYVYLLAGKYPPDFYSQPDVAEAMTELTQWLQLTALPDGSAFLPNGCENYKGESGPCNDPMVADTIPTFVPGGRAPMFLLGSKVFIPDFWPFLKGDPSCDRGNSWNAGRKLAYHAFNPRILGELGLTAAASGSSVTVSWKSYAGATSYEIWGPEGRVDSILSAGDDYSYKLKNFPPGISRYGIVVRGGGLNRILGVSFGQVEIPHTVRRHIDRGRH